MMSKAVHYASGAEASKGLGSLLARWLAVSTVASTYSAIRADRLLGATGSQVERTAAQDVPTAVNEALRVLWEEAAWWTEAVIN